MAAAIEDRREIAFTPLALRFALSAAGTAASHLGLPALPAESVRLDPAEQRITLHYAEGSGGSTARTVVLGPGQLAALLIAYCCRARIPMPRRADKRIRIERDAVVILVHVALEVPPQPAGPGRAALR